MSQMGTRNPAVDAWFGAYDNRQKALVERVRDLILTADPRIAESVKWSTPTFSYRGNLVSFQPRATKFVSLLFHEGASIPGHHPRLEGDGPHVRTMRFSDMADAEAGTDELQTVVRVLCDMRDGATT